MRTIRTGSATSPGPVISFRPGNGNREKVCADCGDIVTELIPATGHIWNKEYSIDKEATCAEEGSESIHCSVCGEIDEATVHVITKKEHTYSNWEITQEATCTEDGIKEKVCAYCGDTITEEIPATGHIWSEEYTTDKEATCIEEGSESIHCAVCGEIDEESVRTIEKKEHTYGDWTVTKEATCTEDGSKEKVCADCGEKVTENIPATGHTWNEEYTVDKEATCAEEGSESIHCSVCEAIDETTVREIPCEEHDFRDWNTVKEPTCTEDGLQEAYCYYYGIYPGHSDIKDTEVIPATGHIWDEDYTVDKEATCAEEGSESIHCSVCGEIDANTVRSIPVKHTWEKRRSVDKEPTFEEDGIDSIHCSLCGAVKEGSERTISKLPKPISMLTISGITAKTYNGKAQTQNVIVKDGAKTLVNGTDYTVSYKNNTNVGTATVTITCVGNYVNSVDKTFAIRKASNTITAKSIVKSYSAQAQSFDLGVKVKSGTPTYKSDNKSVTVTKTGKVTVKAKFIGNANITITSPANKNFASVTKTIVVKVMPTKTKFTSVANSASKKMTLKWVKRTNATGYVIQYSTSSAFASAKTVRVDKNTTVSTTIGNLVKGKKYYVRIKTYRTVSGVKYYSGWSAVETVTIKK